MSFHNSKKARRTCPHQQPSPGNPFLIFQTDHAIHRKDLSPSGEPWFQWGRKRSRMYRQRECRGTFENVRVGIEWVAWIKTMEQQNQSNNGRTMIWNRRGHALYDGHSCTPDTGHQPIHISCIHRVTLATLLCTSFSRTHVWCMGGYCPVYYCCSNPGQGYHTSTSIAYAYTDGSTYRQYNLQRYEPHHPCIPKIHKLSKKERASLWLVEPTHCPAHLCMANWSAMTAMLPRWLVGPT